MYQYHFWVGPGTPAAGRLWVVPLRDPPPEHSPAGIDAQVGVFRKGCSVNCSGDGEARRRAVFRFDARLRLMSTQPDEPDDLPRMPRAELLAACSTSCEPWLGALDPAPQGDSRTHGRHPANNQNENPAVIHRKSQSRRPELSPDSMFGNSRHRPGFQYMIGGS